MNIAIRFREMSQQAGKLAEANKPDEALRGVEYQVKAMEIARASGQFSDDEMTNAAHIIWLSWKSFGWVKKYVQNETD